MMKSVVKFGISLFMAVLCCGVSRAQSPITLPYSYSFEKGDPEQQNWVMDPGGTDWKDRHDQWYIGPAVFSDGLQSLYISTDSAFTAQYGIAQRNISVAYRRMTIPKGNVVIAFDWMANAAANSGLYLSLVPAANPAPTAVVGSSKLPNWASPVYMTKADGSQAQCLANSKETKWEQATYQQYFPVDMDVYLTFIWQNDRLDSLPDMTGACIDNLQITSADCPFPVNLKVEGGCDIVNMQWEGFLGASAEQYSIEYRRSGENASNWREADRIQGDRMGYSITGLDEGVYDFRVRGVCTGTDGTELYSAYASCNNVLVFCPANHCINYVELDHDVNPNVECFVGQVDMDGNSTFGPSENIDYGANEKASRHTVYWQQGQTDPRTGSRLKTIPDGELASVRIGNWNPGAQTDRIEFEYTVDTNVASIILMKYAIVFELPDHPIHQQPFFSVYILDRNGNMLDTDCGGESFYAGQGDQASWHNYYPPGSFAVRWKDWSSLGINVGEWHNQTIKIQITVQDCAQRGHYAYGYFTLGCAEGKIRNVSCGDMDPVLEAPEGFKYQWFTQYDKDGNPADVLGTDRTYRVPTGNKTTYHCRCTFTEDESCKFDLSSEFQPRDPFPEFDFELDPHDCENWVRFINKGHVVTEVDGKPVHTTEPTQTVMWDFGDGQIITDNNPLVKFPSEGDTINLKMTVGIGENGDDCKETLEQQFIVPSIVTPVQTIDTTICHDGSYWFEGLGQNLVNPGTYTATLKNRAGCDSTIVVNLKKHLPLQDSTINRHMCWGEVFEIDGYKFDKPGRHRINAYNEFGCKYNLYVNLTQSDTITFSYGKKDVVGAPNTGEIVLTVPFEKYTYSVNGTVGAPLTGLSGGNYEVVVFDSMGCASEPQVIFIDQECVEVEMDLSAPYTACSDDKEITVPCKFLSGIPSKYRVEYDQKAVGAGFVNESDTFDVAEITVHIPDACRPDRYTAKIAVEDIICDEQVYDLTFDIYYPSDILVQKWNNVIAVKNSKYNGGYDFVAFQWYQDDMPITGEIGSYYYAGEGVSLDSTSTYHVMLTRVDDGVSMPTCPMKPTRKSVVTEYPQQTVIAGGAAMKIMNVKEDVTVSLWNVSGMFFGSSEVSEFSPEIVMPESPGVYMLVIEKNGDKRHYKILVK